ncbi:hypothetical protein TNCV_3332771 [Trichonephila clavipes]|nr:hypothetical protein TNCV_3332771 [Trichonephila clavipes]
MNEDRTTKKVFNAQPMGTQRKGRPNLRWTDGLVLELGIGEHWQEEGFLRRPRPTLSCCSTEEGRKTLQL